MSGNERRPATPGGSPWPVDLLADLHAGVLDERTEAELRRQVESDPAAMAVLAALDATVSDLADLTALPAQPMPADVAARIDAALAKEAATFRVGLTPARPVAPAVPAQPSTAPVVDLEQARRRRNRRIGMGAGLLVTAAAVFGIVMASLPNNGSTGGPVQAQPTTTPPEPGSALPPLNLRGDELGKVAGSLAGTFDYGPLRDKERVRACVQANGIDPRKDPVGVRQAVVDDQPGVMILLAGDKPGGWRLLVVGPDCGPGDPSKIKETLIGPR